LQSWAFLYDVTALQMMSYRYRTGTVFVLFKTRIIYKNSRSVTTVIGRYNILEALKKKLKIESDKRFDTLR
jgi:hypothetical protein